MGCCSLQTKVHLALLFTNSVWGIGAVVGAIGMSTTHPLAFLVIRQLLSGLVLLMGALSVTKKGVSSNNSLATRKSLRSKKDDVEANHHHHPDDDDDDDDANAKRYKPGRSISYYVKRYGKTCALLGLTLFGSQFGFLVGILLAGPVTGSVWQPSQPIFMAFICVIMGWELWNSKRMMGVAMAFCGCIIMVMLSPHASEEEVDTTSSSSTSKSTLFWIGNFLFFLNCLCDPSYVLVSKRLLDAFSPLIVTAISNFVSATYMAIATILSLLVVSHNYSGTNTTIDPDDPMWVWIHGSMLPPREALPAMFWFVLFSSAGAYGMINWANQYATGTLVMSYTVLQPVSAVILTVFLLAFNTVRDCTDTTAAAKNSASGICLTPPNMGTFCGMVGVGIGLSLIILTEPKSDGKRKKSDITIAHGKKQEQI